MNGGTGSPLIDAQCAPIVSRTSLRSVSSNSSNLSADSHSSHSTSSTAGRLSSDTSTRPPSAFTTCICSVLTRKFRSLPQFGQVNVTYLTPSSFDSMWGPGAEAMQMWPKSVSFVRIVAESYEIHSEARGPHWIAWVSRDGSRKPERSVVLVAENREKAEANARRWAEQSSY